MWPADTSKSVGATLLEGKEFAAHQDNTQAVIINDVIAARYWPGKSAVGRYLRIDGEEMDKEVRAVICSSKCIDITDENQTCLYLPLPETAPQAAVLFKVTQDPASAISQISDGIRRLDPNVAVYDTRTLSQHLQIRFSAQSLVGTLATILALVGLVILALGVFALVSFNDCSDDVHSNKPHQQYADFLKSKMYRNDRLLVTCSDCRDTHGNTPYSR
jgi:hypothetical protein